MAFREFNKKHICSSLVVHVKYEELVHKYNQAFEGMYGSCF